MLPYLATKMLPYLATRDVDARLITILLMVRKRIKCVQSSV